MKVDGVFALCINQGNCPRILLADDGDYLVQGYVLKREDIKSLNTPEGEDVVRLPKEFFEAMLASLDLE